MLWDVQIHQSRCVHCCLCAKVLWSRQGLEEPQKMCREYRFEVETHTDFSSCRVWWQNTLLYQTEELQLRGCWSAKMWSLHGIKTCWNEGIIWDTDLLLVLRNISWLSLGNAGRFHWSLNLVQAHCYWCHWGKSILILQSVSFPFESVFNSHSYVGGSFGYVQPLCGQSEHFTQWKSEMWWGLCSHTVVDVSGCFKRHFSKVACQEPG